MTPTTLIFSSISSFLIVASLISGWKIVNWIWINPKKIESRLRAQGLSGNPYRLLYGDSKQMAELIKEAKSKPIKISGDIIPCALPLHHHIIQKYGKASFIWIGPVAKIIIMEPELIKQILINNYIFKKPAPNPLTQFLMCGLVAHEDEKWTKHRRIINPAFYLEKLKLMQPAMHKSCGEMIEKWEKLVMEGKRVEIDVHPFMEGLTSDLISRTAFGSRHEQGRRIFELQKEQSELTLPSYALGLHPRMECSYIPTKKNRRMKEINKQICKQLRGIIKNKEETMKMGDLSGDDDHDLLSILLRSNAREKEGMTTEEVIDECKTFYLAGQEGTANLLSWTMLMLSLHQNWQKQARDEVFSVFGDAQPHVDGFSRLKILTMILHEVLRLYPPAVIIHRIVDNETKLGELILPPGVQVLLPIILIHHDPELWGEDSKEFKPERFSQGVANATKNQLSYFPFSWGPRVCIGNNFALMEATMALAMILRSFSFELSPSYAHAPSFVVTLQPQHGIHLNFTRLQ